MGLGLKEEDIWVKRAVAFCGISGSVARIDEVGVERVWGFMDGVCWKMKAWAELMGLGTLNPKP